MTYPAQILLLLCILALGIILVEIIKDWTK